MMKTKCRIFSSPGFDDNCVRSGSTREQPTAKSTATELRCTQLYFLIKPQLHCDKRDAVSYQTSPSRPTQNHLRHVDSCKRTSLRCPRAAIQSQRYPLGN